MKNLLFFVAIFTFAGCNNEQNEYKYSLIPSNEIVFKLNYESSNAPAPYSDFKTEDTVLLAVWNNRNRSVEIYNLNLCRLVNEIQIPSEGPGSFPNVVDIIFKSRDSIILISTTKEAALIDRSGTIQKQLSFKYDHNGEPIHSADYHLSFTNYLVGEDLYLCQEYRVAGAELPSTEFFNSTYINCIVNFHYQVCTQNNLTYPQMLQGRDLTGTDILRVYNENGEHIYHFSPLKSLFITSDHETFKEVPLVTSYQLELPEENWEKLKQGFTAYYTYYAEHDQIVRFLYDEYRKQYHIAVRIKKKLLESDLGAAPMRWKYPHCLLITLNSDFKVIAETLLPDQVYSCMFMFVTPDGLYISEDHPNNPDFDEDFMRFRLFKLEKL